MGTQPTATPAATETVKLDGRVEIPISDEVKRLIESGEILVFDDTPVQVGNENVGYRKLLAKTLAAMIALAGGQTDLSVGEDGNPERGKPSVASAFNYGFDLNAKRYVRQQWESKKAGPGKKVNRAVEDLMSLGYSQEEAETIAKARLPQA